MWRHLKAWAVCDKLSEKINLTLILNLTQSLTLNKTKEKIRKKETKNEDIPDSAFLFLNDYLTTAPHSLLVSLLVSFILWHNMIDKKSTSSQVCCRARPSDVCERVPTLKNSIVIWAHYTQPVQPSPECLLQIRNVPHHSASFLSVDRHCSWRAAASDDCLDLLQQNQESIDLKTNYPFTVLLTNSRLYCSCDRRWRNVNYTLGKSASVHYWLASINKKKGAF